MREKVSKIVNGKRVIIKKPELLAPAGNLEKLKLAILYGADAVFIGGEEFSLRANAENLSISEIEEACKFAHSHNAKVYVTVNIIAHNTDYPGLPEYLKSLSKAGVDAIIVSEPMVIETAKKYAPDLELHLSTQQSTINYEAINFWEEVGIKRIILARETNKEELKEILAKTNIDIEVFIHGAMCIAYSGRCTLSNHMTARDSNRGGCVQSCRWDYILEGNGHFKEPFRMSPKDLTMLKHIPELIEMGISSLKIEGRMRSVHYIGTVVSVYRKLIDDYAKNPDNFKLSPKYLEELNKAANREIAPQYFEGIPDHSAQLFTGRDETPTKEFVGIVLDYDEKNGIATVEQRNYFTKEDTLEAFGPKIENFYFNIDEILDEEGKVIDAARHPRQIIKIKIPKKVNKNDMIRKRY